MGDISHAKGPAVHQTVHLTLENESASAASELHGRITHVGLLEVTASFLTTSGPFTATLAHDWFVPADASNEWNVRARMAAVDPAPAEPRAASR